MKRLFLVILSWILLFSVQAVFASTDPAKTEAEQQAAFQEMRETLSRNAAFIRQVNADASLTQDQKSMKIKAYMEQQKAKKE